MTSAGVSLIVCMCGRIVTEVTSTGPCNGCGQRITQPCEQCRDMVLRWHFEGSVRRGRLLVMQTYDLSTGKVDESAVQIVLDYEAGNRGANRGGELLEPSVLKRVLSARRAEAAAKATLQGATPCR